MQDIGSGMNYKRKQFIHPLELIEQGRVKTLVGGDLSQRQMVMKEH
jgi:hypothetical protein